jgi:hypothetical protein
LATNEKSPSHAETLVGKSEWGMWLTARLLLCDPKINRPTKFAAQTALYELAEAIFNKKTGDRNERALRLRLARKYMLEAFHERKKQFLREDQRRDRNRPLPDHHYGIPHTPARTHAPWRKDERCLTQ